MYIQWIKNSVFTAVILVGLVWPSASFAQADRFFQLGIKLDDWSEGQIAFWKKIYTEYTTHDYVIHDSVNLTHVYGVVGSESETAKKKAEIRTRLLALAEQIKKSGSLSEEHLSENDRKLFVALDQAQDANAYEFAADRMRLRTQVGQKDRLENAYSISKHYLSRMEEMLTEEGVPKELSRLPFIESGFNQSARSSVGAIGIWQFMPKTAMTDLRVDAAIDERYDPLKSTRAAGRFLKRNEKILGNWGLAIMAYNQGAGLVQKGMAQVKSHDPVQIIKVFKNRNFLFASRNYLFEFLAMSDVDAKHELFFKKEEDRKLPAFITVSFPEKLLVRTILEHYHLSEAQTRLLNPHFRDPIWTGHASIPAHYPVRLTGITLEEFRKLEYPKLQ